MAPVEPPDRETRRRVLEEVYRQLQRYRNRLGLDFIHDAVANLADRLKNGRVEEPRAYAYRAALNGHIDEQRKRSTQQRYEPVLLQQPPARELPPDPVEDARTLGVVKPYVSNLDSKRRKLFEMHFIDDCSAAEAARELRMSERTARAQIMRMRRDLVKLLAELD